MKSLSKMLLALSTIFLLSGASLKSYSQNQQDTIPKNTPTEQITPKKVKRFYKDMNFITNTNLGTDMKDFVKQTYGIEINLGRRFVDEFKMGFVYDMFWGSKKRNDEKCSQNSYSLGLETIFSPFGKETLDPLFVGAGIQLDINDLKLKQKGEKDIKNMVVNPAYFIKAGAQIRLGKKSKSELNLGVKYTYSQGNYEGDKVDLSRIGFFIGLNEN